MRSRIGFLEMIGSPFNIRKEGDRYEAFEGDEVTEERASHLLGIIIGKIKGEPFADMIDLTKG
jgi:hypothetical protein